MELFSNSATVFLKRFILSILFLPFIFPYITVTAQEKPETQITKTASKNSPAHKIKSGVYMGSIPLNKPNLLGVTVVNDKIIAATGGQSSTSTTDNYFYRFTMTGTLIDSFPQPSQIDGYGFRDLAFDGAYIVASDNSEIKFIDTVNFQVHHKISYSSRALHRGLAYDRNDNSVWSLNTWSGPLLQLDAVTGAVKKSLAIPEVQVFGIALENTTIPSKMNIWYAEPWSSGSRIIRLTRIDTATGNPDFSYDLSPNFTANTLVGGLEIISNHPSYPGKTVAMLVEQYTCSVILYELQAEQTVMPSSLTNAGSFGGWMNCAVIKGNNAFAAQANQVNVIDISGGNFASVAKLELPASTDGYVISGNNLYMFYPSFEEAYKNYIEVVDISSPSSPSSINRYKLEMVDNISRLAVTGNRLIVLGKKGDTTKIIKLNISNPASISVAGSYPVEAIDLAASGNYIYMIGGSQFSTSSNSLLIYDISNGFDLVNKTIIQGALALYLNSGKAHIACEGGNGYHLYDVNTPSSPSFLGSFGTGGQSYNGVFAFGNYTILKKNYTLMVILNHSNPSNIQQLSSKYLGTFICSGVINNMLYAVVGGGLQSIDISNPAQPVTVTKQNLPAVSSGIAIKGNALYCAEENAGLFVFDVANPEQPMYKSFLSLPGTNKAFYEGNLMFVTDNTQKLLFYDITDPFNPVYKSAYSAKGGILKAVRKGNYIYIITRNSSKMEIVDIANITSPVKIAEHTFQYNQIGVDLAASPNRDHIYAITKPAAYIQAYVEFIDVSNPSAPRYINRKYGYDKAERIEVAGDIMFVLDNGRSYPGAKLHIVNSADTVNMSTLNSRVLSSTSDGNGLLILGNYIFVSLGKDGKVISIGWDKNTNLIFAGPSNPQPEPADNAGLIINQTFSKVTKQYADNEKLYGYIYTINGGYYDGSLSGSKSIKITRIKIPVEVLPPPDKKAVLTLGTKSENVLVCTSEFPEVSDTADANMVKKTICEFTVSASIDDDWNLMSIKFSASGTGHDAFNISKVRLYNLSGQLVSEGVYSEDNGDITMNINKILGAGQSMSFRLEYQFPQFLKYLDHAITFSVNTKAEWLAATPLTLTRSEKLPPALLAGNNVMIAKVFNHRSKKGFATIQSAIDDLETLNGDVLNICPCLFKEEPKITKSLTLVGPGGNLYPTIQPPGEKTGILVTLDADSIRIENISFDGMNKTSFLLDADGKKVKKITLHKNILSNAYKAFYFNNVNGLSGITENIFSGISSTAISLNKSGNFIIDKNSFMNGGMAAEMFAEASHNTISNNTFNSITAPVSILNGSYNKVFNNVFKFSRKDKEQISIFLGRDNEIHDNYEDTLAGVIDIRSAQPNKIYNNKVYGINLLYAEHQHIYNNKISQMNITFSMDITIENNEITGSIGKGVEMAGSSSIIFRNNEISNHAKEGVYMGSEITTLPCSKNLFHSNKVFSNSDGFCIKNSEFNTFDSNEIYENRESGIIEFGDSFTGSSNNIYVNNLFYKNDRGLRLRHSKNTIVQDCKIQRNQKAGVDLVECSNVKILNSNISYQTGTGTGIDVFECSDYVIAGNLLGYNCRGIEIKKSPNGIIKNNRILYSTCSKTGVWMSESSPVMTGNSIADNNGAGIYAEQNSNPLILGNNISGNTGSGITNATQSLSLNAGGNWWGRASGPLPADLSGNVSAPDWLAAPVAFVCTKESDTLFAAKGVADTASIIFSNLSAAKDTISVTFTDEKGWLKTAAVQKQLLDTANAVFDFSFLAPSDVAAGTINKVKISAMFNGSVIADSLYITAYAPSLYSIVLSPDTATITKGDTLKFSCTGFDQSGKIIAFEPKYTCTRGTIDSAGTFVSDTVSGSVTVTASNLTGTVRSESVINVTSAKSVLTKLVVSPKEMILLPERWGSFKAVGTDQYGYAFQLTPVWSATGGTIDETGMYKSGAVNGAFIVVVKDNATGLSDTARVTISEVIPVELASFTAVCKNKNVQLKWSTITETNNLGFEILRSPKCADGKNYKVNEYVKAGFVQGKVNSTSSQFYEFTDNTPLKCGKYKYRLKQVDLDGTATYSEVVEVEIKVTHYSLEQNYPNPFNPVTNIEYSIPYSGKVSVEIYNSLGQLVEIIKNEVQEAGNYKLAWNGARFASGVYFIRLSAEAGRDGQKFNSVKKMLLVK